MRSIHRIAALVFVLTSAAAFTVEADEPAPPTGSVALTEVLVTAEKREEKLADVPMSVSALPGPELSNLQDRSFIDYAAMVPGLSLVSDQPGLTRLTLRGQNTGGIGSTVAVYVDESPFGSSSALSNGSTNTGDFDTWDLQRVEVLRGPQGTLYGANSEGGLLKFVTNAPVLHTFSGAGETSVESISHGGTGADVHGMVNVPLGDKAALRASAFDQDVAGYVDDPLNGKMNVNDGHKSGGRASLLFVPLDSLFIRLTATSQKEDYNGNNVVDINPVTLAPVHGDLTQERLVGEPSNLKYENYNATINWDTGPVSIVSSTSYGLINTDTMYDYTSQIVIPPSTTLGELLTAAVAPGLGGRLDDNVETKKFTQEIRLSSPSSAKLEWQVGGYFTHETSGVDEHLDAVTLPSGVDAALPALEVPIIASDYKESAGFVNLTYHFTPQFDIQAGGRYSKNEQTATENTTGLLVPTQVFTTPSEGHVFTYSVAPEWHVDANTMTYVRFATGYRPGGPNVLPPVAPPDIPREYGADRTTNVELGVRSTQLDGALSIDVALFHVNWTDVQLTEEVDNFGINGNGGTARSEGVEWSFGYVPLKGLTLQWVGAYTDAILTSPAPAVNGADGDPLAYVPKWSTSLDGEYQWPWFANFNGFMGATWSYVGTRSTDFGSSAAATPAQVELGSYNTYAVRLGVDNDRYRVTLYGKNLSDSRAITSYFSSGAPGLAGLGTVIQPRTIGLSLSAKF